MKSTFSPYFWRYSISPEFSPALQVASTYPIFPEYEPKSTPESSIAARAAHIDILINGSVYVLSSDSLMREAGSNPLTSAQIFDTNADRSSLVPCAIPSTPFFRESKTSFWEQPSGETMPIPVTAASEPTPRTSKRLDTFNSSPHQTLGSIWARFLDWFIS